MLAFPAAAAGKVFLNVFVFRRPEPGIPVPALDLISDDDGSADFLELPPEPKRYSHRLAAHDAAPPACALSSASNTRGSATSDGYTR